MLKQRVITAILLASLLVAALFADDPVFWRAFITIVVTLAFWEWLGFCNIKAIPAMAGSFVLYGALFYALQAGYLPLNAIVYAACASWCVLLLFTTQGWFEGLHHTAVKLLTGVWILPVGGWLVIEMKGIEHGALWIICFMIAVFAADIGAYFVGRRFGKTKLAPTISPGKTVEGLLGGIAFVLLLFIPLLFLNFTAPVAGLLLLTVVLTAIISVGGDLFESKMKRHVGLKDSSNLLPGHGGLLDRIDSLLAAAPFFVLGLIVLGFMR